jgi:DNA-directed RNA polymerase specialized sigma24 family protein
LTEDALPHNQISFLYTAAAKQLYNFALYAIGDQAAAERITARALADAFLHVPDKSSVEQFTWRSIKYLYRYGRRYQTKSAYSIREIIRRQNADDPDNTDKRHLLERLRASSYEERCMLLLFCWMKCSIGQIAAGTGCPACVTRKRLLSAVQRIAKRQESCSHKPANPPKP